MGSTTTFAEGEDPQKWEQLFFPFPIVGAPPQLEQQVQVFDSYFRGRAGAGDVPSVELAYIATPHLGLRHPSPRRRIPPYGGYPSYWYGGRWY